MGTTVITLLVLISALCVYSQPRVAVLNGPGIPFGRPPPPFPGPLPVQLPPGPQAPRFLPGPLPLPPQRRIPLRPPNFVPGGQIRPANLGVPIQNIGGPLNLPPPQPINIGAPPVSFVGSLPPQNVRPSFINIQGQGVGPNSIVEMPRPIFGQTNRGIIARNNGQVSLRGGIPFVGTQQVLSRSPVPVVVSRPSTISVTSPGVNSLRPSGFSTAAGMFPQPVTTTTVMGPSTLNGFTGTFGGFPLTTTTVNATFGSPATVPVLDSTPTLSQVNTIGTQITSLTPSVATTPDELVLNAVNSADNRFAATFTDPVTGQAASGAVFPTIPGTQIMTGQPQSIAGTTTIITSGGIPTIPDGQTISGGVIFAGSDATSPAMLPGQPQPSMNMFFPAQSGMTTAMTGSVAGGRCSASSCPAGQVCVYGGQYLCPDYIDFIDCRCQAGCYAKNTFIPDGVQNMQVDSCGNTCSCDSSAPNAEPGAARCTMVPCPEVGGNDITTGAMAGSSASMTMVDATAGAMDTAIIPSNSVAASS